MVGIGNSAADIVSELAQRSYGNQVVISTRSGAWVIPKYVFGHPSDALARTIPQIPMSWQRRLMRHVATLQRVRALGPIRLAGRGHDARGP